MSVSTPARRTAPPPSPGTDTRWPPPIRALLAGTLIARSAGFAYPFLAYRMSGLGYSSVTAGLVLGSFGVGWLAGQWCAGWLTDRLGYRAALLGTSVLGAVTLPLLAMGTGEGWLLIAAVAAGFGYDAPRPPISAAIVDLVEDPARRVAVSGWRLGAINIGAAATGGIGGLLADRVGYVLLVLANAASFLVLAAVAVPALPRRRRSPTVTAAAVPTRQALRDARLWLLCASTLMAMTCAVGLMSVLPLLMSRAGLSASAYGWTQIANAFAVLVLTPFLTPITCRWAGRPGPLLRAQAISALTLGLGMGSTGLAHSTLGFAAAVTVAVPGEITLYVVATELVTLLAPPHAVGIYHGAFGSTFGASVILAPLLAGWAMSQGGNSTAGLSIVACGGCGALLCLPLHFAMRGRQPRDGCA